MALGGFMFKFLMQMLIGASSGSSAEDELRVAELYI